MQNVEIQSSTKRVEKNPNPASKEVSVGVRAQEQPHELAGRLASPPYASAAPSALSPSASAPNERYSGRRAAEDPLDQGPASGVAVSAAQPAAVGQAIRPTPRDVIPPMRQHGIPPTTRDVIPPTSQWPPASHLHPQGRSQLDSTAPQQPVSRRAAPYESRRQPQAQPGAVLPQQPPRAQRAEPAPGTTVGTTWSAGARLLTDRPMAHNR